MSDLAPRYVYGRSDRDRDCRVERSVSSEGRSVVAIRDVEGDEGVGRR